MKILYLYDDLMNLYGDSGNVKAMHRHLGHQGFDVEVERKTIGDQVDFSAYAFIFCGSGTERNQKTALAHFRQFGESFKAAVEKGVVALFTGNSLEMLGASIEASDGTSYEGLGLLPFHVKEQRDRRYTGDAVFTCADLPDPAVGFINKCSELTGLPQENALFQVDMGMGNSEEGKTEGIRIGNCFGTYLTGPVCVKNPHVMRYLITLIGSREQSAFTYIDKGNEYEKKSYQVTLSALQNRLQNEKA